MPAPLANRFLHLEVEPDFESFKTYALESGIHEPVIAFLSFRTALLHRMDQQQPAWPSPCSWAMASHLHTVGLGIAPVVGAAAAAEFDAFITLYASLIDLDTILHGNGGVLPFPAEPSARYAAVVGLTLRAADATQAYNAFQWLAAKANPERVQLFAADLFHQMRAKGQMGALAQFVSQDQRLQEFMREYGRLMGA
ncbi:MAG: hypothetical protein MI924_16860 [Chloroflexales bacterium]|nr:hypothetical protein [Chloroflexales bacterium]